MTNQWFRLYTEFAYDPKVQVLTEALQRRYVMALCLHCDNKLQNRPDDEIALALRVTVDEWQKTKQEFISRGLFSDVGIPTSWEKRQYISDIKDHSAAERQKRYRERKRNPVSVTRNDTVTSRLPDSDTDTESKKELLNSNSKKNSLKKVILPDWLPLIEWEAFRQMRIKIKKPMTAHAEDLALRKLEQFRETGHDPTEILNQSILSNYQDLYEPKEKTHAARFNGTGASQKPTWASEGQRLADMYGKQAELEEQAAANAAVEPNLRIAETIRENPIGTRNAG